MMGRERGKEDGGGRKNNLAPLLKTNWKFQPGPAYRPPQPKNLEPKTEPKAYEPPAQEKAKAISTRK